MSSSVDDMIKAKVVHDWHILKHVPARRQTEEICMIAIEQDWRALELVVNKTPELCMKTWELYYDKDDNTAELFECIINALGYEEYKSKSSKPVSTAAEMDNLMKSIKKLSVIALKEASSTIEEVVTGTSEKIDYAKSKLSKLLLKKGKISSMLKRNKNK